MTRKFAFAVAATLLTFNLAACSGGDDEAVYTDNGSDNAEMVAPEPAPPTPEPAPPPVEPTETANTAMVDNTPPPVPTEPDQQMMDDASASGMTARSVRKGVGADQTTAADPVEDQ